LIPGSVELNHFRDWSEVKKRLQETSNFEEIMSLLHVGLKVIPTRGGYRDMKWEDAVRDRLLFYIDLADGSSRFSRTNLRGPEERNFEFSKIFKTAFGEFTGQENLRKAITQAACKAFCFDFLKGVSEGGPDNKSELPSWFRTFQEDPIILDMIIWFLRLEPNSDVRFVNCGSKGCFSKEDRNSGVIYNFAIKLCEIAFADSLGSIGLDDSRWSDIKVFWKTRAKLIPVLVGLDRLDLFIRQYRKENIPDGISVNDQVEILKLLAMMPRNLPDKIIRHNKAERIPDSLEEAAWSGSKPARALLLYNSLTKEEERQRKLVSRK
jgi:hypothetical protein